MNLQMHEREKERLTRERGGLCRQNHALTTLLLHGEGCLGLMTHLPDFSVFIIESGMARVVDKGPETHFFTVFQNDICELSLFRTEDEQSHIT